MSIYLSENLKRLRKQKDVTQEALAEFLEITFQAVSKWERNEGYPDITTLPQIASFFNVTVDELLGVNTERNEQKISEYIAKSSNCFNKQDFSEAADILREGLTKFPYSYQIMSELIFILHMLYHKQSEDKKQGIDLEITSLSNKIFKYCSDDMIRHKAKAALLAHYIYDLGDKEKAKEILKTMPKFDYGFQFFEPLCLDGVEKQRHLQQMTADFAHAIVGTIRTYISSNSELSVYDQIALYQKANSLYELLYEKNDFNYNLDMMCSNCIAISQLFIEAKDIESALCFLNKGVDYAVAFDSLTDGTCYTSLLSNKLSYWGEDFDEALNKHEHRNLSICKILYNEFYEAEIYKSVVEDKRFKDVIDKLK